MEPDDASLFHWRGTAHAWLGRWDRAAADYAKAASLGMTDLYLDHQRACLCLLQNDPQGCGKFATALLDRFRQRKDAYAAYLGARACALLDRPPLGAKELAKLAEEALGASPAAPWFSYTLGSVYSRAGRYEEAAAQLNRSLKVEPPWQRGLNWLALALVNQRLGRHEQAKADLEKADRWFAELRQKGSWLHPCDLLEFHVLRREAEGLLGAGKNTPGPGK
jgi:tetratricopeptide (TPR) repeat protein